MPASRELLKKKKFKFYPAVVLPLFTVFTVFSQVFRPAFATLSAVAFHLRQRPAA